MRIEVDTFISFIKNKIYENQKLLNSNKILLSTDLEKELKFKNKIYDELIDDIHKSYDLYIPNIISDVLQNNYNKHHTKLIFYDDSELIIEKNMDCIVDGEFIFINSYQNKKNIPSMSKIYEKGFNITEVKKIETLDDKYVPIKY